jgi:uncharacterized cupin superfamily protein
MNFYIQKIVDAILTESLPRQDFSEIVKEAWESGKFVYAHEEIDFLYKDLMHYSFGEKITEHGREDQPLSISQHILGNESSVAVRLAYDPPNCGSQSCIEYHSHPVDSLVIVLYGSGKYSLFKRNINILIDVSLAPGTSIFFPAGIIHTIKEVGSEGIEILYITDRLNQPNYRDKNMDKILDLSHSEDFSKPYELKSEVQSILYKELKF